MKLVELEQYLYKTAHILTGPIDATDYKAYVLPMLFYKRLSDVYEEEYENAVELYGFKDAGKFKENYTFVIPEDYSWPKLRERTENIGQHIQNTLREIEKANPNLLGIFGDANWTNKNRLSDELLTNMIEHLSTKNLSKVNVNPDMLGQAYEYLIKKFADNAKKKAGEFYTPREVTRLLANILNPKEGDTIYDPACGSGGMLLECIKYVREKGGDHRTIRLFGQEKNLTTSSMSRINLLLHDISDFDIRQNIEGTLQEPLFVESGSLKKFDVIIANPPYSLENWGNEKWKNDIHNRNKYGLAPKSNGDMAWISHMLCSMNKDGRVGVVISNGVLFRNTEKKIRESILKEDLLEAIISLGPDLFYGTNIAPCIMVFRKNKEKIKQNKVLFINGAKQFQKDRKQNFLSSENISHLIDKYNEFKDTNESRIVDIKEIEKNQYNLNMNRYCEWESQEVQVNIKEEMVKINQLRKNMLKIDNEINSLLKQEN